MNPLETLNLSAMFFFGVADGKIRTGDEVSWEIISKVSKHTIEVYNSDMNPTANAIEFIGET